jgi:hypothetical protein
MDHVLLDSRTIQNHMTVAEWHSASSIMCDVVQYPRLEIVVVVAFHLCAMAQGRGVTATETNVLR